MVVAGIGDKHGFPIYFKRFARYCMPLMTQSVVISMLYVLIMYYAF